MAQGEFEKIMKRLGLRSPGTRVMGVGGGQRALRSPVMQQGVAGVPEMSDDPQSKAFQALVQQMIPGLNLPTLNSPAQVPYQSVPMAGPMAGTQMPAKMREAEKVAIATGTDPEKVKKLAATAPEAEKSADWDTLGNDKVELNDLYAIGRYMVGGIGKGLAWLGNQLGSVLDDQGDSDEVSKAKNSGQQPTAKTVKGSGGAPQMQPGATFGTSATQSVPGLPGGRKMPRRISPPR